MPHPISEFIDSFGIENHLLRTYCDPKKLTDYIDRHNNIYPEVCDGLRNAGVLSLHIWVGDSHKGEIFMHIIFDGSNGETLDDAIGPDSDYRKTGGKILEWEDDMTTNYHAGWTTMPMIHDSANWNKKL